MAMSSQPRTTRCVDWTLTSTRPGTLPSCRAYVDSGRRRDPEEAKKTTPKQRKLEIRFLEIHFRLERPALGLVDVDVVDDSRHVGPKGL